MKYVFDVDGTVFNTLGMDYDNSTPIKSRIEKINKLYDSGCEIIFLTARGMGRTDGDVSKSYELFYDLTKSQLDKFGVKYHRLFLGKPSGDIYIDDKSMNDKDFFDRVYENE